MLSRRIEKERVTSERYCCSRYFQSTRNDNYLGQKYRQTSLSCNCLARSSYGITLQRTYDSYNKQSITKKDRFIIRSLFFSDKNHMVIGYYSRCTGAGSTRRVGIWHCRFFFIVAFNEWKNTCN